MTPVILCQEKRKIFYFGVLICALLSVLFLFFNVRFARISFYLASYISIAGMCFFRPKLDRKYTLIVVAIFLLAISKLLWVGIEYIGNPDFDKYNAYLNTGKRLILAGVVAWFLFSLLPFYHESSRKLISKFLMVTFILASSIGCYQYLNDVERVDFYLGRATDAAYMYSALSLACIFILANAAHSKVSLACGFLVFLIAYAVIFSTGTRNVMASFPFIVIFIGLLKFRHLGMKTLASLVVVLGLMVGASYNSVIKPKIESTLHEINYFDSSDGNKATSLSARLAMWNVGLASFAEHPLGASREERAAWFKNYVESNNRDRAALNFVNVHLHNEVMDTVSLQGAQGLIALLLFYFLLLNNAWRRRNAFLMSVVLAFIVSGLTDVVFISREQSIFFALMIILAVIWHKEKT